MEHKFNYGWTLADAKFAKNKGSKAVVYGDNDFGPACELLRGERSFFNEKICYPDKVLLTIRATGLPTVYGKWIKLSEREVKLASSFPLDFNFMGRKPVYICGMSVPPVMMAQVSSRVYDYILSNQDLF